MTLIPGTNREDGPCVVWIGTTIHGLDDVYGPFPDIAQAQAFIDKKVADEWCSKDGALVLMLDQTHIKADILLQTGVPTNKNVCEITKAMFPHGFSTQDNDNGEVIIRTGLRIPDDPDLEDGPLERCYDDAGAELPVDYSWEEREEDRGEPIWEGDVTPAKDLMGNFMSALQATGCILNDEDNHPPQCKCCGRLVSSLDTLCDKCKKAQS